MRINKKYFKSKLLNDLLVLGCKDFVEREQIVEAYLELLDIKSAYTRGRLLNPITYMIVNTCDIKRLDEVEYLIKLMIDILYSDIKLY